MKKVIILTRNIIIEQEFQNELQRLDYEVFVLKEFFDVDKPNYFEDILSLFDIVIFSETLTNQEFNEILPLFWKRICIIYGVRMNPYLILMKAIVYRLIVR